jgi:hypothetical protein
MIELDPALVQSVEPRFSSFEEAEVVHPATKACLGWHSTALSQAGEALGGGFGKDRGSARRIAVAEMVERAFVRDLHESPQATDFHLDTHRSTCGFAAGFEDEPTMLRALCEAVERWSWSKWIDDHHTLAEIATCPSLSPVAEFFLSRFQRVRFFRRVLSLPVPGYRAFSLQFCVVLGYSDGGVFPGSRVCSTEEDPWEHAAIEAWRHRLIFLGKRDTHPSRDDLVNGRILFFGQNASTADEAIAFAKEKAWPEPLLLLLKRANVKAPFHLWRALCRDYKSWHLANEARFVY